MTASYLETEREERGHTMKPITLDDILTNEEYNAVRNDRRAQSTAHKGVRRIVLGKLVMMTFESRDTMLYQIQEMMRVEHISDQVAIEREMATYNELVPKKHQLVATLFVTLTNDAEMREWIPKLIGVDEAVTLNFAGQSVRATSEAGRNTEEKTSSVHYLWFDFSPEQVAAFASANEITLKVDHENYQHAEKLNRDAVLALRDDLTRE